MRVLIALLFVVGVATALPAQRRLRYKYARQGTPSVTTKESSGATPSITAAASPQKTQTSVVSVIPVVENDPSIPIVVSPPVPPRVNVTTTTTPKPKEEDEDSDSEEGDGDDDESEEESEEDDDEDADEADDESYESESSESYEEEDDYARTQNLNGINPFEQSGWLGQHQGSVRNIPPHVDAYIPGYVTEQGEVLVPIDTVVDQNVRYTIVPDPAVEGVISEQTVPVVDNVETPVPAKAPVRVAPTVVDSVEDSESNSIEEQPVVPVAPVESVSVEDDEPRVVDVGSTSVETEEEEGPVVANSVETVEETSKEVSRPPLAFIHSTRPTNEDDEAEARRRHFWRYFNTPSYNPYEGRTMMESYPPYQYSGEYYEPPYYHY